MHSLSAFQLHTAVILIQFIVVTIYKRLKRVISASLSITIASVSANGVDLSICRCVSLSVCVCRKCTVAKRLIARACRLGW